MSVKNEQARRVKQAELRAEKEELRVKQEQDGLEVSRQKQKAELEQHIAQEKIKSEAKWAYEQTCTEKQKKFYSACKKIMNILMVVLKRIMTL